MKLTSAESYAFRCLISKLQKPEPKPKPKPMDKPKPKKPTAKKK